MRIAEQTLVEHIVRKNSDYLKVFWEYGMFHAGRPFKSNETVNDICILFGIKTDELIKQLKRVY